MSDKGTVGIIGQGETGIALRDFLLDNYDVIAYDLSTPNDIVMYQGSEGFRQYARSQPMQDILDLSDLQIFICDSDPNIFIETLNRLASKGRNRDVVIRDDAYQDVVEALNQANESLNIIDFSLGDDLIEWAKRQ